ncbi:MAG: transglycosylase SLT domain-containing protein [Deltaproteobacteria bacterium]|nr:transglycosylase SLT domain-containing protein [Deltaproteobacteria bacterium]
MFMVICFFSPIFQAGAAEADAVPVLMDAIRGIESLDFCGESVPLQERDVRERLEKEILLSVWDRPQVILWFKRYPRYMPHIEAVLAENGLPDDFKYMAVIESALRPHAGSAKGAVGFWQFMADTARRYGLRVDRRIDERRNLFASTKAASAYINDLRVRTGSWTMAAAAYNMGEEGIEAEMMIQGSDNFYHLYLPLETQRFIFRILAAKLILTSPERYGFHLSPGEAYPVMQVKRVDIECFDDMPVAVIAEAAGTSFKIIKKLNPEIRGHFLVSGSHTISIPTGADQGFEERLQKAYAAYRENRDERVYVVKEGDNLSVIAQKFKVPLPALLIWNRIDLTAPIHPGDELIIHPKHP